MRPIIPIISHKATPAEIRKAFEALRVFFSRNRLVTPVDLFVSGISAGVTPQGEIAPFAGALLPPAPTGFIVTGAFAVIILKWTQAAYRGHSHTEVFRATDDDLGSAVRIGSTTSFIYPDTPPNASFATTYYYWIRHLNTDGTPGPFNALAGTIGSTADDPTYMLEILTGKISASELHASLSSRIDIIDTPATGLVAKVTGLETVFGTTVSAAESAETAIQAAAGAIAAQNSAEGSATNAENSATNAETSAANASSSASAASTSASSASTSAGLAGISATAADESKTAAAISEANAAGSASAASTSETNAATYKTAAETAATASTSAKVAAEAARDAAAGSASAASTSASSASASSGDAGAYAMAAAAHANTASTAAGTAGTSATSAAASATTAQSAATTAGTHASNADGYAATAVSAASTAAVAASETAEAAAVITAQYTIKVDANGKIAGIGLWSDGATSEVEILADRFSICNASGTGEKFPFVVQDGVVYMNAALIKDATITSAMIASLSADKIVAAALSAVSANLGTVTAGVVQSSDWSSTAGLQIDLNNKTIISGGSASPRFYLAADGSVLIRSATSGERLEIDNDCIKVYDNNGAVRVKLGDLS